MAFQVYDRSAIGRGDLHITCVKSEMGLQVKQAQFRLVSREVIKPPVTAF
jgi:hypothetical protein